MSKLRSLFTSLLVDLFKGSSYKLGVQSAAFPTFVITDLKILFFPIVFSVLLTNFLDVSVCTWKMHQVYSGAAVYT